MNTLAQKKFKVLLVGDACIDEYQYGTVDRISPEAPVPVFKLTNKETKPGMAANVKENLEALGIDVTMISADKSVKTRLIDVRSKQQIVRIDNDIIIETPLEFSALSGSLLEVDAVVISDYNKGLVSYEFIEDLVNHYNGPIFIDTKKHDLARFTRCYVKINELEFKASTSVNDNLIVTLGRKGAMYKQHHNETYYDIPKIEVTDVCGAGDTFLSAMVYQYLSTNNIDSAIHFANKAAAITIQHVGNYAPNLSEIRV